MKFEEADLAVDSVQSLLDKVKTNSNPFRVILVHRMTKDGYISISGCGYVDTIHFDNKDKIEKWVTDVVEMFNYATGNKK